jgi:hypothetical protein
MDFRLHFESDKRNELTSQIDQYIRGELVGSPVFLDNHTQEELDALEKTYREKTLAVPANAFERQAWLYYASLARDSRYSRMRRTRLKANSLNSLYMESYGGGKIAKDSHYQTQTPA